MTGTRSAAAMTVCAMLNQQGGHLLFGVTPDGRVAGQHVSEVSPASDPPPSTERENHVTKPKARSFSAAC